MLGHDGNAMFNNQQNTLVSGVLTPTVTSVQMTGASYGAANASARDLGFTPTTSGYDVAVSAFDPYSQCYYYMSGGLYPSSVQIMDQSGTHIGSFSTGTVLNNGNIESMAVVRDGLWVQYNSNQTKVFVRGNTANPNWNENRNSAIWTAYRN